MTVRRFPVYILSLLLAGQIMAQTFTDSPYTRFGLGRISQPGFFQNRAMGGTGIAMRNNNLINYLNPASYSAMDSLSFLFDFGIMAHYTYTETSLGDDPYFGMNMDHLAIAFPITRWWSASVGILPYSKVGYAIKEEDFDRNIGFIDYLYNGNGGINQLYLGTSLHFFKGLSLGANFKYLFGSINLTRSVQFPNQTSRAYTEVQSLTIINDFIIDLGIQYSLDFLDGYNLTFGVIFDSRTDISAENTILKRNLFPGTTTSINDSTILYPTFILEENTRKGEIVIPTNFGSGISFNYSGKFKVAVDYYQQDWSSSTFFETTQTLTKSNSVHGGMELIPDPEALRGYHKHMAYRIGGHYQNSYLMLDGEQLKDYGISFGVGLPLRNAKSSFNLAFELGRRGTFESNLIRESYAFISFSLTLHDFWFIKRKFD